jgi:hypothetical protein
MRAGAHVEVLHRMPAAACTPASAASTPASTPLSCSCIKPHDLYRVQHMTCIGCSRHRCIKLKAIERPWQDAMDLVFALIDAKTPDLIPDYTIYMSTPLDSSRPSFSLLSSASLSLLSSSHPPLSLSCVCVCVCVLVQIRHIFATGLSRLCSLQLPG